MIVLLCALAFVASCALMPFPECNQRFNRDAKIVQIAMDKGLCLDEIGNALILANGVNISIAKLYTAEQALNAVESWSNLLRKPISDILFYDMLTKDIEDFPELILLTEAFSLHFQTGEVIDQPTRELLISYLDNKVKPMLEKRLKLKKLLGQSNTTKKDPTPERMPSIEIVRGGSGLPSIEII